MTIESYAAVDLGSNSFHMIVARLHEGNLQIIDRLREMVRLGEGLTADKHLAPEVEQRALDCLSRFGQRLRALPRDNVKIVGTNTLRQLDPGSSFLAAAQEALGHPVEVIAGREEARLIYLGVAHGLAAGTESRLVVDIGGGSTELIVGRGIHPKRRESLHMGCVTMSQRFFADGRITEQAMRRAELGGAVEIRPVRNLFRDANWDRAVGSSGTIRAIRSVLVAEGVCRGEITADGLNWLRERVIKAGHVKALDLKELSAERRPVFAGGLAVLRSVFTNLAIEQMEVSDEALREGLLYELIGRVRQEDVRERSVIALARMHNVDLDQAHRVEGTAMMLYGQVAPDWEITASEHASLLGWGARLHEVGLNVAHSQFHKHGAYLIARSDLSGFSREEQTLLAALVRGHRRKFPQGIFDSLPKSAQAATRRIAVLLRLATLLHRGRTITGRPHIRIRVDKERVRLRFPDEWLELHPLTRLELEEEAERLQAAGFTLEFG